MSLSQFKWLGIVKHRLFSGITFAVTNRTIISLAGFVLPQTELIFDCFRSFITQYDILPTHLPDVSAM